MDSRTRKTNNKRFVRYPEGAEMYSMSLSKFQQFKDGGGYRGIRGTASVRN